MPSEETVSQSGFAWSVSCRPLPLLRLHRLHRPGDGTSDGGTLVGPLRIQLSSIRRGRVARRRLPLLSSGSSSRRSTYGGGSLRSCARGRLSLASSRAVWRHPFPSVSAPRNASYATATRWPPGARSPQPVLRHRAARRHEPARSFKNCSIAVFI